MHPTQRNERRKIIYKKKNRIGFLYIFAVLLCCFVAEDLIFFSIKVHRLTKKKKIFLNSGQ